MRIFRNVISWTLALFLAAMFVQATIHPLPNPPAGMVKFFDAPGENIVFQIIAINSGMPLFEPAGRVVTGFLELLAAVFILVPWTRKLGAFLSVAIVGGAIAFHLSPWLGREVPTSLAPGAETDGGLLFLLAVVMFVASLLLLVVHPGRAGERY
jgi:uncharacterized membrane protein YphA (DoxX/SURF4 family)